MNLRHIIACAGFALYFASEFFALGLAALLPQRQGAAGVLAGCLPVAAMTLVCLLAAASKAPAAKLDRATPPAGAALAASGAALALLLEGAAPGGQEGAAWAWALAAALVGLGTGCLRLGWGRACTLETGRACVLLPTASFLAALGIRALTDSLPAASSCAIAAAGAALSGAALAYALGKAPRASEAGVPLSAPAAGDALRGSLVEPVVFATLFSLAANFLASLPVEGPAAPGARGLTLAALAAAGAALLAWALAAGPSARGAAGIIRVAVLCMATGFLALPFAWLRFPAASVAVARAGTAVLSLLMWILAAVSVQREPASAYRVYGAVLGVVGLGAVAGRLLGGAAALSVDVSQSFLVSLALGGLYLIVVASLLVSRARRMDRDVSGEAGLRRQTPAVTVIGDEEFLQRLDALGEAAGLTRRERDVLRPLSQGRSSASIAEMLVVSENTVKSHIRAIYRKLGVNSRQQVIDLMSAPDFERRLEELR